jgi:outer membrane protein assembly factor BamB
MRNSILRSCLPLTILALAIVVIVSSTPLFAETYITQANVTSLKQVWQVSFGSAVASPPTVLMGSTQSSEMLLFGTESGKFYAVNANTGTVLWTVQTGGPITLPAITANLGNNVVYVYFLSSDGCVYAANSSSGAVAWKQCYPASSTTFIGIHYDPDVAVTYNIAGNGGAIQGFDPTKGTLNWTFSSSQPFTAGLFSQFFGSQPLIATTTTQVLQFNNSGSLVGSANLPGAPTGTPVVAKAGSWSQGVKGEENCPAYNNVYDYAFVAVGPTVYVSQLTPTGPGAFQSVTLTSSVASNPSPFYEATSVSHVYRDLQTGYYYTCTNFYDSDDVFYPLSSGAVSAVFLGYNGQELANGSENAGASAAPLLFIQDESNPFGTTGIVFTDSGVKLLAILTPSGTIDSIFTAHGNLTGTITDGNVAGTVTQRLYFADMSGYVYALSPTGQ